MASRVDFPDPDGPTIATCSPASMREADRSKSDDRRRPGVLLGHLSQLQGRHWATTTLVPGAIARAAHLDPAAGIDPGGHADQVMGSRRR